MTACYLYDGTFTGLLCALFEALQSMEESKNSAAISIFRKNGRQAGLFPESREVYSCRETAEKFWTTLTGRFSAPALRDLLYCFFSEEPGVEDLLLHYVLLLLRENNSARAVFSDRRVLTVRKLGRRVAREVQRYQESTRFRRLRDGLSYAPVEPGYNILPLLAPYFAAHFPGRQWLLHDVKRNTGLFYNSARCHFLEQVEIQKNNNTETRPLFSNRELDFQDFWHVYLPATTGENGFPGRQRKYLTVKHRKYVVKGFSPVYARENS